jgi:hypothetical protein
MPSDKDNPVPMQGPAEYTPKSALKAQPGQKSMFDNRPKPQTPQEFQQKVQASQENISNYKKRAAELFVLFQRSMADKTLAQNRNVFNAETEKEMLQNMLQLAVEINNDPNEQEGMGSLTWITLLFKTCLAQRDRINELEYGMLVLQKKLEAPALSEIINKEISKALDKKKGSE